MVVMSKQLFKEVFQDVSCSEICHPWSKSCIKSVPVIFQSAAVGSAKFYAIVYASVICYLCRKKGEDSALYAFPAGCLAGLSFLFSPSLGLSIASVTAALKLYSTILYERNLLPTNIPLPEIMFCLCQGTLFSARVLHPDIIPGYVCNVMKTISNGRVEEVLKSYETILKGAVL